MSIRPKRLLTTILTLLLTATAHSAQRDSLRTFTESEPLVYEDAWDLWPYAFLNDKGEPDGYNIDLIRMLMKELGIPYTIRLKPAQESFDDLKAGRSDLTLALSVGFHDEYGLYGQNAITLFTQSVATPKGKPIEIRNFHDLGKEGVSVIVNANSLCYHLMMDYGWEKNATPTTDLRDAIKRVSTTEEGQIVWNTLSLKWLIDRYHIENLVLTPVNMPHGEYRFMANSQTLLDRLDEAYTRLYTAERVQPLQDKWFYPETRRQGDKETRRQKIAVGAAGILLLIAIIYAITYRIQAKRLTRINNRRNRRLALILETSGVRLWTYNIKDRTFDWRSENGQIAYTYSAEEFSQRYSEEDFARLSAALDELARGQGDRSQESGVRRQGDRETRRQGDKEEGAGAEVTLELKAKDSEDGDSGLRDFVVALSVLRRNKDGKPEIIIGTKKDITKEREQQRRDEERTLRYWSIFYTPVVGILLFDKEDRLMNINPKACEIFNCDPEAVIAERVPITHFFDIEKKGEGLNGLHGIQETGRQGVEETGRQGDKETGRQGDKETGRQGVKETALEYQFMTVRDNKRSLLGTFAVCIERQQETGVRSREIAARLKKVKDTLREYDRDISLLLSENDLRLVTYSPKTHLLTIRSQGDKEARRQGDKETRSKETGGRRQYALTQTRCMSLVDDRSKNLTMRTLSLLDEGTDREFRVNLRTSLRVKGGLTLYLLFILRPEHDEDGLVTGYRGLLIDTTEQMELKRRMTIETAKVQEVENTKNMFVKNMIQEIRNPMEAVVDYVERLGMDKPCPDEEAMRQGILDNADYLLHLIDNVLYLSRLEAHMVEINKQPCNFAEVFESQCNEGWMKYQNTDTRYIVENPYEQLVVDIDADNLAHAIEQVTANAAQHTSHGIVRARYDYIGRRLVISIDDTGEGISNVAAISTKGLGLAITRELIAQMGGTVEISSEKGSGTTVYMTIPCQASVIKRKKLA